MLPNDLRIPRMRTRGTDGPLLRRPERARGVSDAGHWNMARNLSTFSLVTMVTGTGMTGSTVPPLIRVNADSTATAPMRSGSCCTTAITKPVVDPLDHLLGQIPAENFDPVGRALRLDRGDRADQRRLAGGVDRGHVGVAGDQGLGGRKRVVLDVAAIDHARDRDVGVALDGVLEALLPLILDERVERADDADLGRAAHLLLDVVEEGLADLCARAPVVDPDLALVRARGQDRIDREDRDAGVGRLLHGGHDAVDVDRDDDDRVHALGDVGLDRVVLRRGVVVGVEDHELGAGLLGRGGGALVHLIEEQRLLVDLHERDGRLRAWAKAMPDGRRCPAQDRRRIDDA